MNEVPATIILVSTADDVDLLEAFTITPVYVPSVTEVSKSLQRSVFYSVL